LQKQIEKADNRRVWLKCGGFISIDKTEALTAIDVNSGKYIGKDNAEATIFKVNKQASIEIAKQLRLRDIGGIIIIDYIDMNDEKDKEEIINSPASIWCRGHKKNGVIDVSFSLERSLCSPICLEKDRGGERKR
ncbi:MAG: ribonuclease E/G, partial [Pseudomonadota bacterium]|nr:ribonuclease E/G [Pseudomonadota bacterium]